MHLEPLILALFRKLRELWCGLDVPLLESTFVFSKELVESSFRGGLSRLVATKAAFRFSKSFSCSAVSSFDWGTLSLIERKLWWLFECKYFQKLGELEYEFQYLGKEACCLSNGELFSPFPWCSSRWANCRLNRSTPLSWDKKPKKNIAWDIYSLFFIEVPWTDRGVHRFVWVWISTTHQQVKQVTGFEWDSRVENVQLIWIIWNRNSKPDVHSHFYSTKS